MNKVITSLDYLISKALISLMILIVATVTWQVLSRYLLQSPSSGSEELARFLLIWIGLLGAVYCYRTKAHLGLNIVTNKLPPQSQVMAALLSHIMVIVFASTTLVMGGYNLVNMALDPVQISPALAIKMAHVYAILPLTGVLFCLYAFVAIADLQQHGLAAEENHDGN